MSIGSFFSGLFGKAKETATDLAEQAEAGFEKAKDFAEDTIENVKEQAAPLIEKAEDFAGVAVEKVSEFSAQAGEALGNAVDSAKEHVAPLVEKVEGFATDALAKAEETFDAVKDKAADMLGNETKADDETPKA
jgi:ElaB/YqjD/DUF883 family membrane-anchored ribosome-binding protein